MPKVSVIIPAFNRAALLRDTLNSVIAQTFTDWECIVVDDGSREDLSWVEAAEPRIRRIRQENRGISIARNVGIANSSGELVAFLDSDDLWATRKLELQVRLMQANVELGMSYTCHGTVKGDEPPRNAPPESRPRTDYLSMLERGGPCTSTLMVRRACLRECGVFDPLMTLSEDHDFTLRMASHYQTGYLPECLAYVRTHHAESTTLDYTGGIPFLRNLAAKHTAAALHRGDSKAAQAASKWMPSWYDILGAQAYDAARRQIRAKRYLKSLPHLARACRWAPRYTIRSIARSIEGTIRKPKSQIKE